MAKPTKLPRKLRDKLAKMATAREAPKDAIGFDGMADTFYRAFLPKGSVHTMIARIDEVLCRIETTNIMSPEPRPDRIACPPPWKGVPGPST
jgi:hypothetical protein